MLANHAAIVKREGIFAVGLNCNIPLRTFGLLMNGGYDMTLSSVAVDRWYSDR